MANVNLSSNMSLPIPTPGVDPGPDYANNLNACLAILDGHNHSPGNGVLITPTGLNINADLTFAGNNATNIQTVRFQSQGSPLTGAAPNVGCLYEVLADLFFNDGNGNQIRITQGGAVSGASGTITGLPSGTASAAFSGGTGTFVFQQATGLGANMDFGSLVLRYPGSYPTPSGNFISLQVPSSISSGYVITFPATTPATNSVLTMTTAGTLVPVDQGFLMPTASVIPYAGPTAPSGYLICDGSAISRTTYSVLFGIIGTTYGIGDGSTTFNVPLMSGNVAIGPGGAIGDSVGGVGGESTHTLDIAEMPSHNHSTPYNFNQQNVNAQSGGGVTLQANGSVGGGIGFNGGGGAHNNVQPYLCLNYIIKT